MEKKISMALKELEAFGITDIDMLALISDTSYEIIFYGVCKGQRLQSNAMVEAGLIDAIVVEKFYKIVAEAVKTGKEFNRLKMNIVKYYKDGSLDILYEEKNCRVYAIKKEWRNSL